MWKSEITKDDLDFELSKETIYIRPNGEYRNLKKEANRVALWNKDKGELLALVSTKYQPIMHSKIADALEDALSTLNLEPLGIQYLATPNKNRIWINVDLKRVDAMIDPVEKHEDQWDLGVSITHGLDGFAGLLVQPMVKRVVCSNGLMMKRLLGSESRTHRTSGMDEWFAKQITQTLQTVGEQFNLIPAMYQINITRETFMNKIEKILGKKFMEQTITQLDNPSETNPMYNVTEDTLSLYDGLSALTYINKLRSETVNAYLIKQRHVRIEKVINDFYLQQE